MTDLQILGTTATQSVQQGRKFLHPPLPDQRMPPKCPQVLDILCSSLVKWRPGNLNETEQDKGIAPSRERYSTLAPMDIDTETTLAVYARAFFSPMFQAKTRKLPPGQPLTPASGKDLMDFLKKDTVLDEPRKYIYQIRALLERMAANNILVDMGVGQGRGFVMLPKSYYTLSEVSTLRAQGVLWLAKTLGGRFVHRQVSPAIVHIIGKNDEGEGSGIVFDAHHILTCGHVVSGMDVATEQIFQGRAATIEHVFQHDSKDVAVIRVKEPLAVVRGLGYLAPIVSQKVYRFGYSRVPCSIPLPTGDSPLVMQSGEVTSESVLVLGRNELFLYSAISRPGDSGGAIVSDDGYVVGMTTELSDARLEKMDGEDVFSPHYAGIPSNVLASAVDDLRLGVQLPYETFE